MISSRAGSNPWPKNAGLGRKHLDRLLLGFEIALYATAFFMLIAAAALVVVGAVPAVAQALRQDDGVLGPGILALDRVLLIIIVAELGYTLRTVIQEREIVAEPFLLIGLIAIIRRVLILSAELEQPPQGERLSQLLYELGGLSLMVLAIAVSILILRQSAKNSVLPYLRTRARSDRNLSMD